MDRLSAYYHWNDHQSLEQAMLVAMAKVVNLKRIEEWSNREGMTEKFRTFRERLRASVNPSTATSVSAPKAVHPWRLCPYGEHWVSTHPLHVPPSSKYPAGHTTTRHGHCAANPSGKDQLYPDEIREIAARHFSHLKNLPCALPLKFENGAKFDDLIAGWVQYWNDVLQPSDPLDPNLIKALIASESGFRARKLADPENTNSARGLMQITNATRKTLGDEHGELKDHFVTATKEDLNDPNTNICAGVRWLFQKRKLASTRLDRDATWVEGIREYKGAKTASKDRADELMNRFNDYLGTLQKCGK